MSTYRIGAFFDGTGGNKGNDLLLKNGSETNIARLYECYKIKQILFMTIISLLFLSCSNSGKLVKFQPVMEGNPVYHIEGIKDKRLVVIYVAEFVSSNYDDKDCYTNDVFSNKKRPSFLSKYYYAVDGNYTIDIPIEPKDDTNNCSYNFIGLYAHIQRLHDPYSYSKIWILLDRPLNQFDVYSGYKGSDIGGIPSGSEDLTGPFRTDKKYFRVAPNSSILCGTAYMDRDHDVVPDDKVQFFCVPRIDSGDTKLYMEKDMRGMVNSQFGVDEIIDSNLTVNIVADDNRSIRYGGGVHPDKFREYIPPKKTFFQKLFD